jgi:C-methyltransferase
MNEMAARPLPHEMIWQLTNAAVASRSLHVAADLGVADHLGDETAGAETLAARCGADPIALDRILSLLSAVGIFERTSSGYRHNDASRILRSDHPRSMRAFPQMMNLPLVATSFARLDHAVRKGTPAADTVDPNGLWAYLEAHPDEARVFGEAMAAKAGADIAAVLDAYDFRPFDSVADIGGGRGHLLRAILDAVPGTRGVLFDLPSVISGLDISTEGLDAVAGDFFVDPLPKADAYLLMEVLHDWSDSEVVAILKAVRSAAEPGAVVLVIEGVLRDGEPDPRVHTLDVVMLAVTGGRERRPAEFEQLLTEAGFRLTTVIATDGPMSLIEAVAV